MHRLWLALALAACTEPAPLTDAPCQVAAERLGGTPCTHQLADTAAWDALDGQPNGLTTVYWVLPSDDSFLDRPLFVNGQRFADPLELLRQAFPAAYGGRRADRAVDEGELLLGTLEWTRTEDDSLLALVPDLPGPDVAASAYDALAPTIALRPLVLLDGPDALPRPPESPDITYRPGLTGEALGRVRFGLPSDDQPQDPGDVFVSATLPASLPLISGGLFLPAPPALPEAFGSPRAATGLPWATVHPQAHDFVDGDLLRIVIDDFSYRVMPATEAEADAWWQAHRPAPLSLAAPNRATFDPSPLHTIRQGTVSERGASHATWGGRATWLSQAVQAANEDEAPNCLATPTQWYLRFLDQGQWTVDLGSGPQTASFAQTLTAWSEDPQFLNDAVHRHDQLTALRAAMLSSPVEDVVLEILAPIVAETLGDGPLSLWPSSTADGLVTPTDLGLPALPDTCAGETCLRDALRAAWSQPWTSGAWSQRQAYGIGFGEHATTALLCTALPQDAVTAQVRDEGGALHMLLFEADGEPPRAARVTYNQGQPSLNTDASDLPLDDATLLDLADRASSVARNLPLAPADATLQTEWRLGSGTPQVTRLRWVAE